MKPPATFETPRLRLRPPDADDAAAIFMTWAQDATVSRYMNWRPHRSLDDTRVFLHYCAEGWEHGGPFNWVIALPENGPPIGTIELRPQGHRLEMGYVLARSWWGRGFMTEVARGLVEWALAQPEVHRVWAVCDVENTASARVLEKVGMEREGKLRRWASHPNVSVAPRDCWCYARVKETT